MEWTEDLATGIQTVDEQHRELFRRINALVAAIKQARCKDEIDATIRFLEEYSRTHFADEERAMKESSYDGLAEHQKQHAVYLANIAELQQEAAAPRVRGVSYDLSVTTNQIVVDWIVDHIMKVDRKFGAFLSHRRSS
jgi:hemerythrin